jgi:CRP-like cAMP-binding protein
MGQAYAMAYEPVKERIASVLVRLYEKFGRELPFTHREIAQMAGTTTESCIRTLSQMKKNGWIRGRRSLVELKNLKPIERLLNGMRTHSER